MAWPHSSTGVQPLPLSFGHALARAVTSSAQVIAWQCAALSIILPAVAGLVVFTDIPWYEPIWPGMGLALAIGALLVGAMWVAFYSFASLADGFLSWRAAEQSAPLALLATVDRALINQSLRGRFASLCGIWVMLLFAFGSVLVPLLLGLEILEGIVWVSVAAFLCAAIAGIAAAGSSRGSFEKRAQRIRGMWPRHSVSVVAEEWPRFGAPVFSSVLTVLAYLASVLAASVTLVFVIPARASDPSPYSVLDGVPDIVMLLVVLAAALTGTALVGNLVHALAIIIRVARERARLAPHNLTRFAIIKKRWRKRTTLSRSVVKWKSLVRRKSTCDVPESVGLRARDCSPDSLPAGFTSRFCSCVSSGGNRLVHVSIRDVGGTVVARRHYGNL